MEILVTGCNGQLGRHMRLQAEGSRHVWHFADIAELDITDSQAVRQYVGQHQIETIVNCAAYTNVDKAESDEEAAMLINAEAVGNLAAAMREVDGWLIHISTDYVFGGNTHNTPCTEDEPTNPTGAYGRTKLQGEQMAQQCKSIVVRTSWLYSEYGKNFLLTMLRLTEEKPEVKVVFDQIGTPTYAGDLAKALFGIVENGLMEGHEGIYHYSNEGVCSWYDFAREIGERSGHTACRVLPCHSNEFPSPVKRPPYSVLDKTKFKTTFKQEIPHWIEGLKQCLERLEGK